MQFLAGTGYRLALFFDLTSHEKITGEVRKGIQGVVEVSGGYQKRENWLGVDDEGRDASRLLRKVIFLPPPKENAGIWPYTPVDKRVSFVIGHDLIGNDVEDTAFYEGEGVVEPDTRIYFRNAVLDKYRAFPDRYQVSSLDVWCPGHWSCPIADDHGTGLLSIRYSDLRGNIPPSEQLHWRQYNVADRQIISRVDPTPATKVILADLLLTYSRLNRKWEEKNGWHFFEEPKDQELFNEVTTAPENKGQARAWTSALHILLHECTNVRGMKRRIKKSQPGGSDGNVSAVSPTRNGKETRSDIIRQYLEGCGFPDPCRVANFVRDLADIRATVVHKWKRRHEKTKKRTGIDLERNPGAGCQMLAYEALQVLKSLQRHLDSDQKG